MPLNIPRYPKVGVDSGSFWSWSRIHWREVGKGNLTLHVIRGDRIDLSQGEEKQPGDGEAERKKACI